MVYKPKYEQSPEGRVMRQLRQSAELTQREVAALIGVSSGCYGIVELGTWRPSERIIRAFCKELGLPLSMEERLMTLRASDWVQPNGRERTPRIRTKEDDQSTEEMISN